MAQSNIYLQNTMALNVLITNKFSHIVNNYLFNFGGPVGQFLCCIWFNGSPLAWILEMMNNTVLHMDSHVLVWKLAQWSLETANEAHSGLVLVL